MRITAIGPKDQLPFATSDLAAILGETDYRTLPAVSKATRLVHLQGAANLLLRWETACDDYPEMAGKSPEALETHITEWYLPELKKLGSYGIPTVAHHLYVADADPHANGQPTIFTVRKYIPALTPLFDRELLPRKPLDPQRKRVLLKLAESLHTYYLQALTTKVAAIHDIDEPRQYYGEVNVDSLADPTAKLFDLRHTMSTSGQTVKALLGVKEWKELIKRNY